MLLAKLVRKIVIKKWGERKGAVGSAVDLGLRYTCVVPRRGEAWPVGPGRSPGCHVHEIAYDPYSPPTHLIIHMISAAASPIGSCCSGFILPLTSINFIFSKVGDFELLYIIKLIIYISLNNPFSWREINGVYTSKKIHLVSY